MKTNRLKPILAAVLALCCMASYTQLQALEAGLPIAELQAMIAADTQGGPVTLIELEMEEEAGQVSYEVTVAQDGRLMDYQIDLGAKQIRSKKVKRLSDKKRQLLQDTTLSLEEAVSIAPVNYQNIDRLEVQLKRKQGQAVYLIEVQAKNSSTEQEYTVDAKQPQILSVQEDDD
ncbi:PepSY domain-containing protein [Streptococcus oriscaviae]|uniref:PepSY domain-containing protein n=1 Tax=Streptococcus oriscaviae TaxID=2781599 RepID=A0ABX7YJ00_9STRE|nr:PepSY domain-containing protein [Streptococcus oriscaviae]QUE53670.1 PepSY domain-containing protein [Streptococcus oriscaviae]